MANLDEAALTHFWELGHSYVDDLLNYIYEHIDKDFHINRAIDFGCGVGRVLFPLAQQSKEVIGVDISPAMIREAKKRKERLNIQNVEFVHSDDELSTVKGNFNFIHSFIVFQHIPTDRGEKILRRLILLLEDDGIGVVHLSYERVASAYNQFMYYTIKRWSFLSGLWNLFRGRGWNSPVVQWNSYSLNRIMRILQDMGCHDLHVRFTNHSNIYYGIILIFRKRRGEVSGVE